MKPDKMILCGWGPYKGRQEIDFSGLKERGLFLITGPTGAGKTTVFDAITYALFGNMSGGQREKNSVRSDFAEADTETYVELWMTHNNKQYHIYRNPEYYRPSKRKDGAQVKEKENAVLTDAEGKVTEGAGEVTRRIQDLMKLDYRQFKQLSMIAQGEFSRMLSAASGEKTRIFRELFGTDVYEKIAASLKYKSAGLYKEIMEYRHKMDEDIDMLVRELILPSPESKNAGYYYEGISLQLKELIKEYGLKYQQSQKRSEDLEAHMGRLSVQITEAERQISLKQKLIQETQRRQQLQLQKKDIVEKENTLHRQEQADRLYSAYAELNTMEEQCKKLISSIEAENHQADALRLQNTGEEKIYNSRDEIEKAYEDAVLISEAEAAVTRMEKQSQIKNDELCKLQREYLCYEKTEEEAKLNYEQADRHYRHGIAGILAMQLMQNEPCPVCGSKDHPVPAVAETKPPSGEELQQLKEIYEEKQKDRITSHGKAIACLAEQTEADRQLEEQKTKYRELVQRKTGYTEEICSLVSQVSIDEFHRKLVGYEQRTAVIEEKRKNIEKWQEEKQLLAEKMNLHKKIFETNYHAAGFESLVDLQQVFLKTGEKQNLREEIQKFYQDCSANEELCKHLQEELADAPEVDIQSLKLEAEQLGKEKKQSVEEQLRYGSCLNSVERSHKSLQEKQKQLERIMSEYSLVKGLDDAANGNNRKRLVFEQYVLAFYFEEILAAANLRLRTMSGGRYELRRMEQIQDGRSKDNLEIEVMDFYTGKYRSVKTLSGGESFKASLALALGMSDIVQAGSGGIRVEALFIDEGFGSLDSESLEQACTTLQGLVEKERLIGIISHVPELAEKIGSQIRIGKTNAGSTIEVMLN